MSNQPDTGFWNKRDIALGASIGMLILFGSLIILLITQSTTDVKISGTLDANTIWVAFLAIVLSAMQYLGFKAAQNSK